MAGKERLLRRKNFLTAALIAGSLWIVWLVMFFFVPPEGLFAPIIFLIVSFATIFFTAALLFANTRQGLLMAIGVSGYMVLRYFEIGSYLNLILLAGIIMSLEYFLTRSKN